VITAIAVLQESFEGDFFPIIFPLLSEVNKFNGNKDAKTTL
jgi:hypothetical protein